MDKKHCHGCKNDYYNGRPEGDCWSLKDAKLVTLFKIHMDCPQDKASNFQKVRKPNCFYSGGYSGDGYAYYHRLPDHL